MPVSCSETASCETCETAVKQTGNAHARRSWASEERANDSNTTSVRCEASFPALRSSHAAGRSMPRPTSLATTPAHRTGTENRGRGRPQ
eukprot:1712662-Prymnesium_polylepis.1